MARAKRLSICYVAPGHFLLPSAGPSRNVLELARAMGEWADLTIAFRSIIEPPVDHTARVVSLEPRPVHAATFVDDAADRGIRYTEFLRYLGVLRRFVAEHRASFDVLLEKNWLLSGYVSAHARRQGLVSAPMLNFAPVVGLGARRRPTALLRHWAAWNISRHYLRRAPVVIAETPTLRRTIAARCKIPEKRIEVAELGVDRQLFRPRDRAEARWRLGIDQSKTVLMYVGILDQMHDLRPVLEGFTRMRNAGMELHIVGDGRERSSIAEWAALGESTVVMHGRVPHRQVPDFIGAADICLAPFDRSAFPGGEVGYSTLKVREYLSAGRPVATVASGSLRQLVEDGVTGFFLQNERCDWERFLMRLPPRERLARMGESAAETELQTWRDSARGLVDLCARLAGQTEGDTDSKK